MCKASSLRTHATSIKVITNGMTIELARRIIETMSRQTVKIIGIIEISKKMVTITEDLTMKRKDLSQ
jgi:hypothetical protein